MYKLLATEKVTEKTSHNEQRQLSTLDTAEIPQLTRYRDLRMSQESRQRLSIAVMAALAAIYATNDGDLENSILPLILLTVAVKVILDLALHFKNSEQVSGAQHRDEERRDLALTLRGHKESGNVDAAKETLNALLDSAQGAKLDNQRVVTLVSEALNLSPREATQLVYGLNMRQMINAALDGLAKKDRELPSRTKGNYSAVVLGGTIVGKGSLGPSATKLQVINNEALVIEHFGEGKDFERKLTATEGDAFSSQFEGSPSVVVFEQLPNIANTPKEFVEKYTALLKQITDGRTEGLIINVSPSKDEHIAFGMAFKDLLNELGFEVEVSNAENERSILGTTKEVETTGTLPSAKYAFALRYYKPSAKDAAARITHKVANDVTNSMTDYVGLFLQDPARSLAASA